MFHCEESKKLSNNSLFIFIIYISGTISPSDSSSFIAFVFCNFTFEKLRFPLAFLQLYRNSIKVLGNEMTKK